MTVKELIEKLKEMPEDFDIYSDTGHSCCGPGLVKLVEKERDHVCFYLTNDKEPL